MTVTCLEAETRKASGVIELKREPGVEPSPHSDRVFTDLHATAAYRRHQLLTSVTSGSNRCSDVTTAAAAAASSFCSQTPAALSAPRVPATAYSQSGEMWWIYLRRNLLRCLARCFFVQGIGAGHYGAAVSASPIRRSPLRRWDETAC